MGAKNELTLRERLKRRLPNLNSSQLDVVEGIVTKYQIKLTMDNLDLQGLILRDLKGRSVRISFATMRENSITLTPPQSDIAIIVLNGMVAGWVSVSKLENLEDLSLLEIRMLNPMPSNFDFSEQCAHMNVHGGFMVENMWECAGCGQRIVPNER